MANFGFGDEVKDTVDNREIAIELVFDPVTKVNFKLAISNAIEKIAANAQSKLIIENLKTQMAALGSEQKKQVIDFSNSLVVKETEQPSTAIATTNSVQHNVPAWTMFAMFLILFPLLSRQFH